MEFKVQTLANFSSLVLNKYNNIIFSETESASATSEGSSSDLNNMSFINNLIALNKKNIVNQDTILLQYIYNLFNNKDLNINYLVLTPNSLNKSIRNNSFMELLTSNGGTSYNSYIVTENSFLSVIGNDVEFPTGAIINPRRYLVHDLAVLYDENIDNKTYDYFPLKRNPLIKTKFQFYTTLDIPGGAEPYVLRDVNKISMAIYYPNTMVYFLIDVNPSTKLNDYGVNIYVMTNYTTRVYPLNDTILPTLQNILVDSTIVGNFTLPSSMSFISMNLNSETYLNAVTTSVAYNIYDGLYNIYTYLDPYYAKFVYNLIV
jgi:hypothetical protein